MQIQTAAARLVSRLETKARRPWREELHPRDSKGRFIETGGIARMWGGGMARVVKALGGRNVLVENLSTHERSNIHASRLTMVARPDGTAPTRSKRKVRDEDARRDTDGRRGTGIDTDDAGDQGDTPDDAHDQDDEGNGIGDDVEGQDHGAGPEPDDDEPAPAPAAKRARRDPKRRFKSLEDVREHWKSGNLRSLPTSSAQGRDNHTQAMARMMDRLGKPQLSPNGHFVVGQLKVRRGDREVTGWGIMHTESGIRLTMTDRKAEAVDFANRMESAELDGEPFDWNDPDSFDRLATPEGIAMAGRLATEAKKAFAERAAKKHERATARTKPAEHASSEQQVAQQITDRTGVPAGNVAVGHVGPKSEEGGEEERPRNDAELREFWKRGGSARTPEGQRDMVRRIGNDPKFVLHLADNRGFAIVEDTSRNDAYRFELRGVSTARPVGSGLGQRGISSYGNFADRESANRFALYLGSNLRDGNGRTVDWGSPRLNGELNQFRDKDGRHSGVVIWEIAGQFDRERGVNSWAARGGTTAPAPADERHQDAPDSPTPTVPTPASQNSERGDGGDEGEGGAAGRDGAQPGEGEQRGGTDEADGSSAEQEQRRNPEEPEPSNADATVADALTLASGQIQPVINELEQLHGRDAAYELAERAARVVEGHEQGELPSGEAISEFQSVLDDIQRATRGLQGRDNIYIQDLLRLARENVGVARAALADEKKRDNRRGVRGSGPDVLEDVSAERGRADGQFGSGGVRGGEGGGDRGGSSRPGRRTGSAAEGGDAPGDAGRRDEAGEVRGEGARPSGDGVRGGEGARDGDEGHAEGESAGSGRVRFGTAEQEAAAPSFEPPANGESLVPSSPLNRAKANIEAIEILGRLEEEQRPATPDEQRALARWSGWGAVPQIFKPKPDEQFAPLQATLRELLSDDEWGEARANTKNAHYTDPQIVQQIWAAMADLGFDGGHVLEPGSGSGNFIGYAPDGADVTGVELDPITARISKALYPHADIRNESFGATRAPNGTFDVAVGNVPFGKYKVTDLVHNKGGHSVHNHFILKSLDLTRSGGLVAMVTSSLTMDGHGRKAEAARMEMAEKADLVGAIRLPSGAHQRTAGTNVVTDLLIFRRRDQERTYTSGRLRTGEVKPAGERGPKDPPMWVHSLPRFGLPGQLDPQRDENAQPVFYNSYFHDNPQQILGELSVGHGMHRADELRVDSNGDPIRNLRDALKRTAADAGNNGLGYQAAPEGRKRVTLLPPGSPRVDGHVQAEPDGTFSQVRDGMVHPFHVPKPQADEARRLLAIRDSFQSLLAEESRQDADESLIERMRTALNDQYEEYVAKYGAINRFEWAKRTVTDPVSGERVQKSYRKKAPRGGLFRKDPTMANIASLDSQDDNTGKITRVAIFYKRQGVFRQLAERAEAPEDALAVVLEQDGKLTPEGLARVMGTDVEDATARLLAARSVDPDTGVEYPLAFRDPDAGLVTTADYLSGNVRAKLAAAREAALDDPDLGLNVEHLERVVPPDLSTGEIAAPLGASWVGREPVQQFLRETLGSELITVGWQGGALWAVDASDSVKKQIAHQTRDTWSAKGYDALKIAEAILTNRKIRVTVTTKEGTFLDREGTADAEAKAELLKEEFTDWLWRDPERAERFRRLYNDQFNAMAPRSYDGQRRTMPGLVEWFKPHPHQHSAVARMVNEPSVLLAHEVGAGKTAEMAMGVMELRRLGLVKKAAMVVPGHMLDQFRTEFAELYPESVANNRILSASSEDLAGSGRREFIARAASGDYDAIILTQTAFESIQMRPEVQESYIRRRLEKLEEKIRRQKEIDGEDNDTRLVKRMETQLSNLRAKLEKKLSGLKDSAGLHFEDMGIDYLVVDEAHMYKNLYTPSSIDAVAIEGSNRASDLDMKLEWLRQNTGTGRVVTFATATPVANSIAEVHVMMRYLRPDLLQQLGIEEFDDFASTFAQVVSAVERSADGTYTEKTRLAAFQNVPELMRIWRAFADVKTSEDLDLPVPDVAGGKAVTITMPMSEAQEAYEQEIARRAWLLANTNVDPRDDNHLKLLSDGRASALDPRLIDPDAGPGNKLPTVADNITRIYEQTKDTVYPTSKTDDTPHETPGGLQIVFLDLGTPKDPSRKKKRKKGDPDDAFDPDSVADDGEESTTSDFSTYDEMKKLLVARGIPEDKIRYIHDAKDDAAKARLFHDARTGRIAVLLGSTFKMGTGTNVQLRATALHHVDAPWRPADVEQRNGRIIRQGNANPEVAIFQYATERSTDAKFWEAIARKSRFIQQLMRGSVNERVVEDIGDIKFDADEASALVAGDPHLIAQAQLRPIVKRLRARANAHQRSQEGFQRAIHDAEVSEERTAQIVGHLEGVLARRQKTRGADFNARIGDTDFAGAEGRDAARDALNTRLRQLLADGRQRGMGDDGSWEVIGQVGGLEIQARYEKQWNGILNTYQHAVNVDIPDLPGSGYDYQDHDLIDLQGKPQRLVLMRIEDEIARIEPRIRRAEGFLADKKRSAEQASGRVGKPFELAEEFAKAQRQMAILDQIMRLKARHVSSKEEEEQRRAEIRSLDQELRDLNGEEDDVLAQVSARDLDLNPRTPVPPAVTQDAEGRTRFVWPDAEAREAARNAKKEAKKQEAREREQRRGPVASAPDALGMDEAELDDEVGRLAGLIAGDEASEADVLRHAALERERNRRTGAKPAITQGPAEESPAGDSQGSGATGEADTPVPVPAEIRGETPDVQLEMDTARADDRAAAGSPLADPPRPDAATASPSEPAAATESTNEAQASQAEAAARYSDLERAAAGLRGEDGAPFDLDSIPEAWNRAEVAFAEGDTAKAIDELDAAATAAWRLSSASWAESTRPPAEVSNALVAFSEAAYNTARRHQPLQDGERLTPQRDLKKGDLIRVARGGPSRYLVLTQDTTDRVRDHEVWLQGENLTGPSGGYFGFNPAGYLAIQSDRDSAVVQQYVEAEAKRLAEEEEKRQRIKNEAAAQRAEEARARQEAEASGDMVAPDSLAVGEQIIVREGRDNRGQPATVSGQLLAEPQKVTVTRAGDRQPGWRLYVGEEGEAPNLRNMVTVLRDERVERVLGVSTEGDSQVVQSGGPQDGPTYGGEMTTASELTEGDWVSVVMARDGLVSIPPALGERARVVGRIRGEVSSRAGRVSFTVSSRNPQDASGEFNELVFLSGDAPVERLPEGNAGRTDVSDLKHRMELADEARKVGRVVAPEGWVAVDGSRILPKSGDRFRIVSRSAGATYINVEVERSLAEDYGDDSWAVLGQPRRFRPEDIVAVPEGADVQYAERTDPDVPPAESSRPMDRVPWEPDISDEPDAELVDPAELRIGDRVRVDTQNPGGTRVTREGFLLTAPQQVTATRDGERVQAWRLHLSENTEETPSRATSVAILRDDKAARLPAGDSSRAGAAESDEKPEPARPQDDETSTREAADESRDSEQEGDEEEGSEEDSGHRRDRDGRDGNGGEPPRPNSSSTDGGDENSDDDGAPENDEGEAQDDRRERRRRRDRDRGEQDGGPDGPDGGLPSPPHLPDRRDRDRDRDREERNGPDGGLPSPPRSPDSRAPGRDADDNSSADRGGPDDLGSLVARYRSGDAPAPQGADPVRHAEYLRGLASNDSLTLSPGGGMITWTNSNTTWRFGHAASGLHLEGWEVDGEAIGGREGARRLAGAYEQMLGADGEGMDVGVPVLDPTEMRAWRDAEGRPLTAAVARVRQDMIDQQQDGARRSDREESGPSGERRTDPMTADRTGGSPADGRTSGSDAGNGQNDSSGTSAGDQADTPRPVDDEAQQQYAFWLGQRIGHARTVLGDEPLLSPEAEADGISVEEVFSEPSLTADGRWQRYASDALKRFFSYAPGRRDFAQWSADGEDDRLGDGIPDVDAPQAAYDPSTPRFLNLNVLREHIRSLRFDPYGPHGDPSWWAAARSMGQPWKRITNGDRVFLSPGRRLVVLHNPESSSNTWQVRAPGSMRRLIHEGLGQHGSGEGFSSKKAAMRAAIALERVRDADGNVFPWDAPDAAQRAAAFRDKDGRSLSEAMTVAFAEHPPYPQYAGRYQQSAEQVGRRIRLRRDAEQQADAEGYSVAVRSGTGPLKAGDEVLVVGSSPGDDRSSNPKSEGIIRGRLVEDAEESTLRGGMAALGSDTLRRLVIEDGEWRGPDGTTMPFRGTAIVSSPDAGYRKPRPDEGDHPDVEHEADRGAALSEDSGQLAATADSTTARPTPSNEPPAQEQPSSATAQPRDAEDAVPGAASDVPDTPPAPEPVGGRPAEWVKVNDLALGDLVRIEGITKTGTPRTLTGYVVDGPKEISTERARRIQGMYRALIADTPDGRGKRHSVWVTQDATAARATGEDDDQTEGGPLSGAEADVRAGRVPERVPTDGSGQGLFPGSIVTDANGREGVVTGASADSVRVQFGDDRTDDAHSPTSLNVTDGGAGRPSGWTAEGHRVRPDSVVGDRDGNMLGTVEDVEGDTATVATPDGMQQKPIEDLRVVGGVRDSDDQAPAKVGRLERVPVTDIEEGDVVLVDTPDGMTAAEVTGKEEISNNHIRVTAVDTTTGELHTLDGGKAAKYTRLTDGEGGPADLGPEDAPETGTGITS
ncbi:DEAD/DEAH box helicase family protein, partial [Streptomyces sp. NPDC002812]|uniref:DEAD/DEAH box helicase family protein n=1 Tax=Streptomyces sp. NPDC002812 TaxID=3154434 RepID=UPI0033201ADB